MIMTQVIPLREPHGGLCAAAEPQEADVFSVAGLGHRMPRKQGIFKCLMGYYSGSMGFYSEFFSQIHLKFGEFYPQIPHF